MTLDELNTQHSEQNAKLDRILAMNASLVRDASLTKTKSSMTWSYRGTVLELALSIVAVVWLGNFIAGHGSELRFLLPALLLDVCAIAFLGTRVLQLTVMSAINNAGSTETAQNQVEHLRRLRKGVSKWTMAFSFVLWLPIVIVGLQGLLGVDAWRILGAISDQEPTFYSWIFANLAIGVAAMLGALWVSKRHAGRNGQGTAS
jgi:hypothetical protein